MMCQMCSNNIANTHIKTIVNGELREYALCSKCAEKMGYGNIFSGFGMNLGSFLESFLGSENIGLPNNDIRKCPKCGSTFNDISKTGKIGCADCYNTFREELVPIIKRIHGNTTHVGLSNHVVHKNETVDECTKLRNELKIAIENQEFERAAELRDKIKGMEGTDK